MNTPVAKLTPYVTTAFDPRTIPGCQIWYDAADINTLTIAGGQVGGNITQWNDKSGNGYHIITRTTAQYPVYASNFNGTFPTVQGLGSAYMTTNAVIPTSNIQGPTGLSFFLLVSYQSGVVFVNYTPGERFISFEGSTRFDYGQPGVVYNTGTSFSSSQQLGFFVNVASRNLQLYQNGTLTVNANNINVITNTYTGRFTFFGTLDGQYGSAAKVSEAIVFNRILSTSERQTVEGYLARKWGLTGNIPATHPFKSFPPLPRLFQPTDISGCTLWLDAADSASMTFSGANITQWNDKSGNGNNAFNSTGTLLPTLGTNSVSLPAVDFNSAYLMNNNAFGLSNMSVFIIGEERTTNASNVYSGILIFKGISGGPNAGTTEDYAQTNALLIATPNSTETTTSIQIYSQLPPFPQLSGTGGNGYWTYRMYEAFIRSGTASELFVNGTSNASYTLPNRSGNSVGYLLSARQFNGSFTVGRLKHCEVLSYDRVLSTSERQQIEGYLANKWALRGSLASTHPFKLYNAVTPAFTPVQISGCSLWLDAADSTSITLSGTAVTQWNDKSGNGYTATASAGAGPTFTTTINNVPCISSANTKFLTMSNFNQNFTTATSFWIMRATQDIANIANYPGYLILNGIASGNIQTGLGLDTASFIYATYLQRNGASLLNGTLGARASYNPVNDTMICSHVLTGTLSTSSVFKNGTSLSVTGTNGTLSNQASVTMYIAGHPSISYGFDLGEVLVYNSVFTTPQRQAVEGYLANKWGLTGSLPATHPYKKFIN